MTKKIITFLLIGLISIGGLSFAWSQHAAVKEAKDKADALFIEFDHRLPDTRQLNDYGLSLKIASGFLERHSQNENQTNTIFIGSSFVWGYPLAEQYTLPSHYESLTRSSVLSYSRFGSTTRWSHDIMCIFENRNFKPKKLIISVPYTNNIGELIRNEISDTKKTKAEMSRYYQCGDKHENISLADIYSQSLTKAQSDALFARKLNKDPRKNFSFGPLKPNYFATSETYPEIRDFWLEILDGVMANAVLASDDVTFIIPPIFLPAVERAGFDIADIQHQIDDALALCENYAEKHANLSCFYPGDEYVNDVSNFANLTHPNGIGFERYAKLLIESEQQNDATK